MTSLRPRVLLVHFAAILAILIVVGQRLPPPAMSDRAIVETVGRDVVSPGCVDIHCFRILTAAVVERLPGESLPRWRTYAALGNAAGAAMIAQLAIALGLTVNAALLAMWMSALTVGCFTTLYNPYTSDPTIFFLAPLTVWALVRRHAGVAAISAGVGILAKEFAAAPLFIYAAAQAWLQNWTTARRTLTMAAAVTGLWIALQASLIVFFNYTYGGNPSVDVFRGGYFAFWLRHVGVTTAVLTLFSAFGAAYLLAATGLRQAPALLRALAVGCVLPALAFMYVETPDRALFNFSFVISPLASLVLAELPRSAGVLFLAAFGVANLRLASAWPLLPDARYATVVSLLLAGIAMAAAWRARPSPHALAGRSVGAV